MRKLLLCVLCALFVFGFAAGAAAFAPDDELTTRHVVLMEASTGLVLFEKDADTRAYPASTTKIMTCILALEHGDLDETVKIPSVTERGSTMGIRKGETMSLRSLLYGIMLISGNDAAEAVAVHIGGSKAEFVEMMNEKAAELGMHATNFVEPSGLHKEEHYTTARDFARLTQYALMESPKSNDFRAIIKKPVYTVQDSSRKTYVLENGNKLVHTKEGKETLEYRNAIGVKTGDTDAAMRCLVAAAEADGKTLISVQLYDKAEDYRFRLAAELFQWGFANFTTNSASALNLPATVEVKVANSSFGDNGELPLTVDFSNKQVSCLLSTWEQMKSDTGAITTSIVPVGELVAPIEEGALVATVAYKYEGIVLFTADAYASRRVEALGIATSTDPGTLETPVPLPSDKSAGPWLFIILVLVAIALFVGVAYVLRNRRKRLRRKRNNNRAYAHRAR